MKLTDVIRRPLITEKTSILREDGRTIVFEVATAPTRSSQARHREAARRQGREHPDQHRCTARQAAGTIRRPASGLEEGYVTLREGAKMLNSWKGP
jgi:hypothetical protein